MTKNKKLLSYIIILNILVLTVVTITPVTQVCADSPGTVEIDESVLEDDILYYNYVTVKFTVTRNAGWFYGGSWIYINNVCVGSTSNMTFEKNYYPEAYAGSHSIYVEANFVNFELETAWADDTASYKVVTCVNRTDLEDLRIDKLHEYETGRTWLDGSGITICIADDALGAHEDLDGFHKSVFRSGKNDIYDDPDRKFIDIDYYEYNASLETFEQNWDSSAREDKWEELFEENKANYNFTHDVHGMYTFSVLRQIAPAAKYIFIATNSSYEPQRAAIDFILENNATLGIDIFCFSYSVTTSSYEAKFNSLEELGIITVNSAGNEGETFTYKSVANKPACYESVIGVTGVYDSNYSISGDRWMLDDEVTNGYGIDIATVSVESKLDWAPVPNYDYFNGTSNSCPIVAGSIALLKQYRNIYRSDANFTIDEIQEIFKYTGDLNGTAPRLQSSGINGSFEFISTGYPTFPYCEENIYFTYGYGWGIIDAYEMYQYYKNNY